MDKKYLALIVVLLGLLMIDLSFVAESQLNLLSTIPFYVTPHGAIISNLYCILALAFPIILIIVLIRKQKQKTTLAITLFIFWIISILIVSLVRAEIYTLKTKTIFLNPSIGKIWIHMDEILSTCLPFLLLTGGIFILLCSIIIWKPNLVSSFDKLYKKLQKFPKNPEVRFLFWIIGIAIVLRVIWIFIPSEQQMADFYRYHQYALSLSQGKGYISYTGSLPTAYWPVGYPYFLSLIYRVFGPSIRAAQFINILLWSSIVPLTYVLGKKCISKNAGKLAAIIIVFFPSQITFCSMLSSEGLFTPLMLGIFILVMHFKTKSFLICFIIGVLTALTALVRPLALVLPLPFLIYYLLNKEKLVRSVVCIVLISLGIFFTLVPWMLRNYIILGKPVLVSTNGGINLWIGNSPLTTGTYELIVVKESPKGGKTEVERDKICGEAAWRYIKENPSTFLVNGIKKMYYFYGSDLFPLEWNFFKTRDNRPIRIISVYLAEAFYIIIMMFGIVGIRMWIGKFTPTLLLPAMVIGLWTLIHFVYFGLERFHAPILPYFVIFSTITILKVCGVKKGGV